MCGFCKKKQWKNNLVLILNLIVSMYLPKLIRIIETFLCYTSKITYIRTHNMKILTSCCNNQFDNSTTRQLNNSSTHNNGNRHHRCGHSGYSGFDTLGGGGAWGDLRQMIIRAGSCQRFGCRVIASMPDRLCLRCRSLWRSYLRWRGSR